MKLLRHVRDKSSILNRLRTEPNATNLEQAKNNHADKTEKEIPQPTQRTYSRPTTNSRDGAKTADSRLKLRSFFAYLKVYLAARCGGGASVCF